MSSSVVSECLEFFMEQSNIDREPRETLASRLVTLRVLYSIRKIDVGVVLQALAESGRDIGLYDAEQVVHVHERQKLTVMDAASWNLILQCFSDASLDGITKDLQAHYSGDTRRSPFLNLRRIVEEACPNQDAVWSIFVQMFLAYHSKEVRRDELVGLILQTKLDVSVVRDLVICVLGQTDEETTAQNLQHDVVAVMRSVTVHAHGLMRNVYSQNEASTGAVTLRGDLVQNPNCRFSLAKLRENVLRSSDVTDSSNKSWKPQSVPYVHDTWNTLSSAQQQIVLFIAAMQITDGVDRDGLVSIINTKHNLARVSFKHCVIEQSDSEQTVNVLTSLLLKICLTVDPAKSSFMFLVHEFVEACFQKSLGQVQRTLMSPTLKTQLFILAYLTKKIRAGVYFNVVTAFNDRAFSRQRELALPDSINTHVQDCMQEWISNRPFPEDIVHEVFKPLCV